MITYKFKTSETGIDNRTRMIIATEIKEVTETREFTLEQFENGLEILLGDRTSIAKQIDNATVEITEIKKQLEFGGK